LLILREASHAVECLCHADEVADLPADSERRFESLSRLVRLAMIAPDDSDVVQAQGD
jgi:hypothetical protein